MLEELTKDQKVIMEDTRQEFMGLINVDVNKKEAIKGVKFVYGLAGLKEPEIVILDSPMACQVFCNIVQNKPVKEALVETKKLMASKVWKTDQIKAYTRYTTSPDNLWSCGWGAFYEFFKKIGVVNSEKFDKYVKYLKSGIFSSVYFDEVAVLSKNPTFLSKDDKDRMDCEHDMAIAWFDGYGQHYVNGVFFEPELYDSIYVAKTISPREILKIGNVEQRALAMRFFGYEKLIKEMDAVLLDTYKVKSRIDGKMTISELYEFEMTGNKFRFVIVEDHTDHTKHPLGVEINELTSTAKGAVAWTFGYESKEQYNPTNES